MEVALPELQLWGVISNALSQLLSAVFAIKSPPKNRKPLPLEKSPSRAVKMSEKDIGQVPGLLQSNKKGLASDLEGTGEVLEFSHIDEKKVLRKMDIRLIPMLALLYLLSFLDRGNIGNASIEGLKEDLGLTGPQYNWCCRIVPISACILYNSLG